MRTGGGWQADETAAMIRKLDIKPPDPDKTVGTLSGGNQQKVLLGKWLAGQPKLLVLHEPTQAVDVGARHDIIDAIREAAADSCGVLISSVDAADLPALCDRVLVLRAGAVVAELAASQPRTTSFTRPSHHRTRKGQTLKGQPAHGHRATRSA